ncbi:TRAP transporter small permease [Cereibacter sphaeroides]|uniref:TRAP transporter small permease subunit n=1 Tax=Cereibacter sphaeroides TaxID=1063 RepID=UPI000F52D59E|nr:TRAP transporter small permease [Cereibacter sphaeroides]AZB65707.1 TRAP transporter small permease [Cereibacter sphaeroides]AZB70462.1 TRAP transporter small permease [Cereibacter sphaeroides]
MTSLAPTRFRRTLAVIDGVTDLGGYLAALCLLGILVLVAAEIFSRNLLAYSIHFSWDLAGYFMGTCFLLASGSALKGGSHVRVTALLESMPRAVGRTLEFAACLVGLAICAYMSWALIEMAWLSAQRGSTAATSFRVPLVYPQAALATGATILTLQCLAQILRLLRGEELSVGPGLE